ncbi:orotidine-5'-phosphate decarboxylase [Synechococcus sp. PCC 7502]|uniref:orotidine-5'-phosphate decarboxylase n=1 Tax=Synechococcus sp. PCC 7502 TaxID=1173263 RepID=UPI00029FD907|nr:orotidine-5'-phosphate decarboxylase [Synechococcus sp. PCC 7502]AFY74430.1 orotidine-5'-phosphate decarboxylase [Synechococcus sp. PCC 7502]
MNTDQIIIALDVPSLDQAIALVEQLPTVTFWKVGLELFTSCGIEIIRYLKSRNKKVFLDLKLHDIPNTVAATCRVLAKYEVDFLTVHAIGGRAMLEAAQSEIKGSSTQLLAVTILTSISAQELGADLKIPLELSDYVLTLALMAQASGIAGCVCSAHELKVLRSHIQSNFYLVTPGIRLGGGINQDQNRVMTPKQAIALGADYLVIGRPITQAPNPLAVWQEICQQIST